MQNPLFFDSVPKQLGSFLASLGTFGGLLALIYFAGRGIVGKFVDWRFYVKRETTKHKFELEQQQMVIVLERQIDDFQKVLSAMQDAIEIVDSCWDPVTASYEFRIRDQEQNLKDTLRVFDGKVFVDAGTRHALQLFRIIMQAALINEAGDTGTREEVWRAHDQMKFIYERVAEHFRTKMGAETDTDALQEIDILGACLLLNEFERFAKIDCPVRLQGYDTAHRVVAAAQGKLELLQSELSRLRQQISLHPSCHLAYLSDIDRYIRVIHLPRRWLW